MINVYHVSTEQYVDMKLGVLRSKNATSLHGSNWQHQLRLASLYSWHIMTLRHA